MFLDKNTFSIVVKSTPLISIDLVVIDADGQVLLGRRLNKPAQGAWFVPGGRVLKNESLAHAFKRLTKEELGLEFTIEQANLLGPFEHFYQDNVFGEQFSTHYIVLAYRLKLNYSLNNIPLDIQHDSYQWFEIENLLKDEQVHQHTKWYFTQYK
jgi:colanic acid biosynthesis protein WcaH